VSLRSEEWCVCDRCGCQGPHVISGFPAAAQRAALGRGWRAVPLNPYGGKAHFCRPCSAGKSDADLLAALGLPPPDDEDDPAV
jgi:hypothetical protein